MKKELSKLSDPHQRHATVPRSNAMLAKLSGNSDDHCFLKGLQAWNQLVIQTARRLERQIGRPESEFNMDCLEQELMWQICQAFRGHGIRNHAGLATTVVRNRARDILRRARACGRTRSTVSLDIENEQLLIDRRQQNGWRMVALRSRLNRVLARLSKVQRLAVATACQSETAAAAEIGISRRQLRKLRSEVRVELERRGLREYLSSGSEVSAGNPWHEVS